MDHRGRDDGLGQFLALLQDDLKRLMAYSSIAHAGYMMVGVTAAFANDRHAAGTIYGSESVFFYLVAYGLMTLGVFGGFMATAVRESPVETVDDLSGLGWTHPWAALGLSICLLSLAGIPPLAGFWGKFQIFGSLLAAGERGGFGFVRRAGGHRHVERGRRCLLLPAHHRGDVLSASQGTDRDHRRLAGHRRREHVRHLDGLLGLYSAPLSKAAHTAAQTALSHRDPPSFRSQSAGPRAEAGLSIK